MNSQRNNQEYDKTRLVEIFDRAGSVPAGADSIPAKVEQIAVERLNVTPDDVVLDVGCGTGEFAVQAALICKMAIGVDISQKSLQKARERAVQANVENIRFAYGELENPEAEIDLASLKINKALMVYSLHHLPDDLKVNCLKNLTRIVTRPARIIIGDLMFFEEPANHRSSFAEVHYDDGDTDFPCPPRFLASTLKQLGAEVKAEQVHPLAGVIIADFNKDSR